MKSPESLLECEERWRTSMGVCFGGERVVFRGHNLHTDLASLDWMELYLFGITGRRFTPTQMKVLNRIWTYTSYPEPRVWVNRVVALAGTARSTGALAVGAAVAVSEASIYGGRPFIRAIDFLLRTQSKIDHGEDLREIVAAETKKHRGVVGYGRPFGYGRAGVRIDERITPTQKLLVEVGMEKGRYVLLAHEVERIVSEQNGNLQMNIAGLYAAICADLGFAPREFYLFMLPCFIAGMLPCFIEASDRTEGHFFPLRCERIAYTGPDRRSWQPAEDSYPVQNDAARSPFRGSDPPLPSAPFDVVT